MGQAASRDGGSQAEGGEDEGKGHEWTQFDWVLTSFPFEKNREMREEGGMGEKQQRGREGGSALPSVRAVGGASLCCCRSLQSQGPYTGSTGQVGGT